MPTTGAHGITIPDPSTANAIINHVRDLAIQTEAGLADVMTEATDAVLGQVEARIGAVESEVAAPVTPQRTSFFDYSTNLFDKSTILAGHAINATTGEPTPNATLFVSAPIPVTGGQPYTYAGPNARIAYYGESGFISSEVSTQPTRTVTMGASVTHVRFGSPNALLDTLQINEGTTLLPYEVGIRTQVKPEYVPLPEVPDVVSSDAGNLLQVGSDGGAKLAPVGTTGIAPGAVTPDRTTFFDASTNLFDKNRVLMGYVLPSGSTTPTANASYSVSDPIPVTPGQAYTFVNILRATYLDAGGARVSFSPGGEFSFAQTTVTTPASAVSVRLSVRIVDLDVAQMNEGPTLLPYQAGDAGTIKAAYLPTSETDPEPDAATVDPFMVDAPDGLAQVYTAPAIAAQPGLDATTTADVHGWYDALVTAHPEYVTRSTIGTASNAATMYAYTLKAPQVSSGAAPYVETASPAALLISGVHGYEKAAVYHLWRFAQALCTEWEGDPVLDAIRWGVEVVIVPVGNPHSYDASNSAGTIVRPNANGVDIARNFPALWTAGTAGTDTYPGTAPLSEPETVALNTLMTDLADRAVFGSSFHSYTTPSADPWSFIWQAAASQWTLNLGRRLITRMTRKWRADHAWITETAPYFGWTDISQSYGAPPGSEGRQMVELGIQGATFETSRGQRLDGSNAARHTTEAMTLGYEATVNYIALGIHGGIALRNS